nr:MAG TPA: hypothetical protein [Caudoviricetes sp.]
MVSSRNGKREMFLDRTSNFSLYCIFLMRHLATRVSFSLRNVEKWDIIEIGVDKLEG